MCGIVGYIGKEQAAPILLEGLSRLEYRGYDSAGICVASGGALNVEKSKGRLQNLREKTDDGAKLPGTLGIGHTRWATHGAPSQTNAHPHVSGNCVGSASGAVESDVVGVHNGIIENFQELKDKLAVSCDNQPFIAKGKMVLVFLADCSKWYRAFENAGCQPRDPAGNHLLLGLVADILRFQRHDTTYCSLQEKPTPSFLLR